MNDFILVLAIASFLVGFTLIIIKSVILIKRNKESDLIYRLQPVTGLGIKKARSDLLFPLFFLLLFIVDAKHNIYSYSVLICYLTYSIMLFMDAFISIDVRNRGVFTKFRFIPWEDIVSINLVKRVYRDRVVSRTYVLELTKKRLIKKLKISTDFYDNSGGIIGEILSERGFQINVATKSS